MMECGASEYEIYFNYILKKKFHPDKVELRKLQFENVSTLNLELDLDYISLVSKVLNIKFNLQFFNYHANH